MCVTKISEILIDHTIFLHCESNFLNLEQYICIENTNGTLFMLGGNKLRQFCLVTEENKWSPSLISRN